MMDPDRVSIGAVLRTRLRTLDGRIVLVGSLVHFPSAVYLLFKAWALFPNAGVDQLLLSAFLHLATPVMLVATWVKYGAHLEFRPSRLLTGMLILIAIVPALVSF